MKTVLRCHYTIASPRILASNPSPSPSLRPKDTGDPYNKLLSEFPLLTRVCSSDSQILHDVTHHIEMTGPPAGFHPEGIILGGKLQEMGVALYTFLYNCPKFWGGSFPPPPAPPWMKPCPVTAQP